MERVNVYNHEFGGKVVARVKYNDILDYWDGSNYTNGGTGRHKGLTKLRDGSYVLIYGTQWQGESDYGLIVSKDEALQEILKSGNTELLDLKKWKELKELYDSTMLEEIEEDEE